MKQKAFTLIELLVVIAIIGLLAGITLTSLKGTRKKATIGKALSFSQSINNGLGAYAIGIWSFDDSITDREATDLSGYNNHGEIFGSPVQTKGIMRSALDFNGSSDYLNCGTSSILFPASTLTIEVWIKVHTFSGWPAIVGAYQTGVPSAFSYLLEVDAGGSGIENRLAFFWSDGGVNIESTRYTFNDLTEWTHVVVTFDSGTVKFYENGTFVFTETNSSEPDLNPNPSLPLKIGKQGLYYFDGEIDELRIYNVALTAGEIQKHYAKGLEKHKLVEK